VKGTIARIGKPEERVLFVHEDKGDLVPAYTSDGKRFEAWTSYFEIAGEPLYVQVEKASTAEPDVGEPLYVREAVRRRYHDAKACAELGYDFDSIHA